MTICQRIGRVAMVAARASPTPRFIGAGGAETGLGAGRSTSLRLSCVTHEWPSVETDDRTEDGGQPPLADGVPGASPAPRADSVVTSLPRHDSAPLLVRQVPPGSQLYLCGTVADLMVQSSSPVTEPSMGLRPRTLPPLTSR